MSLEEAFAEEQKLEAEEASAIQAEWAAHVALMAALENGGEGEDVDALRLSHAEALERLDKIRTALAGARASVLAGYHRLRRSDGMD